MTAYASQAAKYEEPPEGLGICTCATEGPPADDCPIHGDECTCEDGTGFCPEHDDEDEAIDWETAAELRAELREERER